MRNWLPLLWVILALPVEAGQGRYLTWLDDQGRVHNTFIQAEGAAGGFWRSGPTPEANSRDGAGWANNAPGSNEAKRRYFTCRCQWRVAEQFPCFGDRAGRYAGIRPRSAGG